MGAFSGVQLVATILILCSLSVLAEGKARMLVLIESYLCDLLLGASTEIKKGNDFETESIREVTFDLRAEKRRRDESKV